MPSRRSTKRSKRARRSRTPRRKMYTAPNGHGTYMSKQHYDDLQALAQTAAAAYTLKHGMSKAQRKYLLEKNYKRYGDLFVPAHAGSRGMVSHSGNVQINYKPGSLWDMELSESDYEKIRQKKRLAQNKGKKTAWGLPICVSAIRRARRLALKFSAFSARLD